jgi:hypothetical protein
VVPHKKNLLEAFQSVGGPKAATPPPSPPSAAPAPVVQRGSPEQSAAMAKAFHAARRGPPSLPRSLLWIAGAGLVFAVGLTIGRGFSDSRAQESEPDARGPLASGAPATAGSAAAPAAGASIPAASPGSAARPRADLALWDRANRYTLVVVTYAKGREDYAWATHDYLSEKALPVCTPIEKGKNLVVLMGAAPTSEALATLQRTVRELPGPNGEKRPFDDAYVEKIDTLVDRAR